MLDNIARLVLTFSNVIVIVPLLIYGYIWRDRDVFYRAICMILFSMLLNCVLKIIFKVPLPAALGVDGFAFPSGHMQSSTTLYAWLAYNNHNNLIKIFFIVMLIAIGFSLVYCGYHDYSDVVAGVIVAIFVIFFTKKYISVAPCVLICFASVLMAYIATYYNNIPQHAYIAYCVLCSIILLKNRHFI